MKKTFVKIAAAVLAASALFFVACKQPGVASDYEMGTMSPDTVTKLAAPKVTALSYPGVIIYSWEAVSSAESYDVQIISDNGVNEVYNTSSTGDLYDAVLPSADGVKYTIRVAAISSSDPARSVSVFSSEYGTATVTSIVPPAGTKAVDLGNYDTKKSTLTSKDISVTEYNNNVYVSFPAKVYASYDVSLDRFYDEKHIVGSPYSTDLETFANDKNINLVIPMTSAGTYSVNVTMKPMNSIYIPSVVTSDTKVTHEKLLKDAITGTGYAKWVYGSKNAVRVAWQPATQGGVAFDTDCYKVYRRVQKGNELVEVKGTVLATDHWDEDTTYESIYYYIDDEVPDVYEDYKYIIVLTKDGKYAENTGSATISGKSKEYAVPAEITGALVNYTNNAGDTEEYPLIQWSVMLNDLYQTAKFYLAEFDADRIAEVAVKDFADASDVTDYVDMANVMFALQTKATAGKVYYLMAVVTDALGNTAYTISDPVNGPAVLDLDASNATLEVLVYDSTETNQTHPENVKNDDVVFTVSDVIDPAKESIENYEYNVVVMKVMAMDTFIMAPDGSNVTIDLSKVTKETYPVTMEKYDPSEVSYYNYKGYVKLENLEVGMYQVFLTKAMGDKVIPVNQESFMINPSIAASGLPTITFNARYNVKWDNGYDDYILETDAHLTKQLNVLDLTVTTNSSLEPRPVYSNGETGKYGQIINWVGGLKAATTGYKYTVYETTALFNAESYMDQSVAVWNKVADFTKDSDKSSTDDIEKYLTKWDGDSEVFVNDYDSVKKFDSEYVYKTIEARCPTYNNKEYISYMLVVTDADGNIVYTDVE